MVSWRIGELVSVRVRRIVETALDCDDLTRSAAFYTALLDATPLELPKSLIDMESQQLAERAAADLQARGISPEQLPVTPASFEETAKRRVALGLIIGELARTEAGGYHVCTGVAPDLMEASRAATRAAIAHIVERRGGAVQEAYALASVACDLRIHEVVDVPNWVVGCFVPDAIFGGRA